MSKDKIEVNMNVYDIPILVEALEKANKEIETHIKLNKQLLEDIDRAGKEIERLNNIINELERILQLEVLKTRENSEYNKGLTNAFNYAIHMISELKGADEE